MGLGMNGIKFAVGTQPKIGKRDEKEGNLRKNNEENVG